MITINNKTGALKFNLKNQKREMDLCMTLTHLKDQESKASIKITTSYNEHFLIKVPDVLSFKYTDAEYVKTSVEDIIDRKRRIY
jgi:hypothetical protein